MKSVFKSFNIVNVSKFLFYFSVGITASEISILSDIPIAQVHKFLTAIQRLIYQNEENNIKKIGGINHTVEIDESQVGRRKNNVGRLPGHKIIFGGICRENKEFFMKIVENKSREVLGREIIAHILPGTTIFTDQWTSYMSFFSNLSIFYHNFVNHKLNFVDPIDGTHTQTIESLWSEFKRFKRKYGYSKQRLLNIYITEFKIRKRFKNQNQSSQKLFKYLLNII
ncbi:hypothetical protein H312_01480 [Anncaliia algerae PRA339]|uniref:ISXO2-like transposase domain-containing protein n=1 Tax=Anncaliia algerae PRA339 TaxID=1288291 RepID=A0A059F2A7_9MICR|nr:hypothetical protein H312_01480 [Anncaliia algerae PRA339]